MNDDTVTWHVTVPTVPTEAVALAEGVADNLIGGRR